MTGVLLVSPTAVPGGAERALTSLARQFPTIGFEPHAVLLREGPLEGWLGEVGCPVTVIPTGRTRHVARTTQAVARLRSVALREHAQVVISNQSKGHFFGGLAALGSRVPAVWWQQGIPSRSFIERSARLVPSAAVVCSSDAAMSAQAELTPHRRIVKIHLGVPVRAVSGRVGSGAPIRKARDWATPVIGIVGRLQPWKGQKVFLHAAAIVARERPDVRFAVVGGALLGWEGSYPDDLRNLALTLGIADKVHFAGHQDDVIPWFDALDIVVHASFGEPFGLVLVEAMTLGKPLVAAADGGPLEIVEDGVSGLLVPPGDHERLAESLLRLLREPSLARALSVQARARAEEFSEERMAEDFAELVRDILSRGPDGRGQ